MPEKATICFFILIAMLSCSVKENRMDSGFSSTGKELEIRYAKGFSIKEFRDYSIIKVTNPWQKADNINYYYILTGDKSLIPDSLRSFMIIETPVERVVCMSTTHLAMIEKLQEIESVVGISGKNLINNRNIQKRINENKIRDVGYDQAINYETILSLSPDILITYGVTGEVNNVIRRLENFNIAVVMNAEYLEHHPLAKAEWIKFMAVLFNKQNEAELIFNELEQNYLMLKQKTESIDYKPVVISGLPWKDTWYVPGGKSFAAQFIADAGGHYVWSENQSMEAIPMDLESVFSEAGKADIWINSGAAESMNDILQVDPRLSEFKAFREMKVYNNNARLNDTGGNDYWESGVVNPHIILADLIEIFHPELLPGHKLVYYQKIK